MAAACGPLAATLVSALPGSKLKVAETDVSPMSSEDAEQRARDEVLLSMPEEDSKIAAARVARGEMNFEDFFGVSLSLTGSTSVGALPSAPVGYERIIAAMTLAERRTPALFRENGPMVDERVARIAEACGITEVVVSSFVRDFGSIQSFFANTVKGKTKRAARGLMAESIGILAKQLSKKPRRERRYFENKNRLLKDAGRELRGKGFKSVT
eukprot:CAMPEP_0171095358 /NCGR_PEP_ID=MMETSP0766_2-20121228/43127_1 /TAXON_ID=439317 /ORGANISM="Gambierdiscus australes, Strain CAWD 149" /LENGTH=211 /DNA_ID=CAMNT_0011554155 /DNA_START=228 /DNA_END=864 /DNA_ORIENTATION=+